MKLFEQITTGVEEISAFVNDELLKLSDDQLNFKPNNGWSLLECIEHLNRYNRYYLPAIERSIAGAKASPQQQVSYTWIGRKSIAMMHPDNARKQKTFKRMDPSASTLDRNVMEEFLLGQAQFKALISKARYVMINEKAIPLEFFKLFRMNTGEAIEFVFVHQKRHYHQLVRILQSSRTSKPVLAV